MGDAAFTLGLDAAVLTCLAVLIDAAALGELCLAALTGTSPDFVATAFGTKFLLGCGNPSHIIQQRFSNHFILIKVTVLIEPKTIP
ncbi:hypothetical protein Tco_0142843 [Tanacetum coccineum]